MVDIMFALWSFVVCLIIPVGSRGSDMKCRVSMDELQYIYAQCDSKETYITCVLFWNLGYVTAICMGVYSVATSFVVSNNVSKRDPIKWLGN